MTTTVQPTHSPEAHESLGSLASLVAGRLTTTADPDYDRARTPWVVNVDQRPAAVLEVADVHDVVAAVRWGAAHGVPVAVQPGGHAPRTTLDGTLLLRTRALQGIDVDPVRRTASCRSSAASIAISPRPAFSTTSPMVWMLWDLRV